MDWSLRKRHCTAGEILVSVSRVTQYFFALLCCAGTSSSLVLCLMMIFSLFFLLPPSDTIAHELSAPKWRRKRSAQTPPFAAALTGCSRDFLWRRRAEWMRGTMRLWSSPSPPSSSSGAARSIRQQQQEREKSAQSIYTPLYFKKNKRS